jgi:hypothetical protein
MSKKIGEALVEKGIITEEQLKVALNTQLVRGGHLGTCMIELGHVDEDQLGWTLAEVHGVGYAAPPMFSGIPQPVTESIPKKLVERHRVVPIKLGKELLHVAMVNPRDLQALDDLAFAAGCKIRSWVAPEIRIVHAMEAYYGIARTRRFIVLSPMPNQVGLGRTAAIAAASIDGPGAPAPAPSAPLATAPAATDNVPPSPVVMPSVELGIKWEEITGESEDRPDAAETATGAESTPRRVRCDEAGELLVRAENADQIAEAILDWALADMPRGLFFMVDSLVARVWDWRGFGLSPDAKSLSFRVTTEPLFQLVAGNDGYRGPIPDDPACLRIFHKLEIDAPSELMILPVYLDDALIALYCGDCGENDAEPEEFTPLMRKIAMALNILALKRRLRQI